MLGEVASEVSRGDRGIGRRTVRRDKVMARQRAKLQSLPTHGCFCTVMAVAACLPDALAVACTALWGLCRTVALHDLLTRPPAWLEDVDVWRCFSNSCHEVASRRHPPAYSVVNFVPIGIVSGPMRACRVLRGLSLWRAWAPSHQKSYLPRCMSLGRRISTACMSVCGVCGIVCLMSVLYFWNKSPMAKHRGNPRAGSS
jgi:hypothetical protein